MIRLDKRSKFYKTFSGYKTNDYIGAVVAGLLAGMILGITLYRASQPVVTSPQPPQSTIKQGESIVKVVEAKEESMAERMFNITRHHESSWGTNKNPVALHNYCKKLGKWNEIGYSPKTKFCFGSQEEAKKYMDYYVTRYCSNKSLTSCLCYWNTGKNVETCAYSGGDLANSN